MKNLIKLSPEQINDLKSFEITSRWCNFGKWKQDFKGNIYDFMNQRNVKISVRTMSKSKPTSAYHFEMELSSTVIIFESTDADIKRAAWEAAKLFVTALGDPAKLYGRFGYRGYNIAV